MTEQITAPEALGALRTGIEHARELLREAMSALDPSSTDGWAIYQRLHYGPLTVLGELLTTLRPDAPTPTPAEDDQPPWRDPAEHIAELEGALNRLHSWDGLMHLLDEHWPAEVFPTLPDREGRDSGPRIVSLIRALDKVTRQRDGLDDELSEARAALTTRPSAPTVVEVHHYDIEKHAEHFNEGYDEAQRQGIGGEETRDWLVAKVAPILRSYGVEEHDGAEDIAGDIADAVLSEAPLSEESAPTVTTEQVQSAARELDIRHFDGQGCGDSQSTGACSNCFGPSPMRADEVVKVVIKALGFEVHP